MPPFKESKTLLYLIMLLGFVGGYLYNSQSDPAANITPVPANLQISSLKGLDTLKIDYSVLTSTQYQELKVFGQLPVTAESGGRADPFQ